MKYRIQFTVDGFDMGALIDLAFQLANGRFEPDPKFYPIVNSEPTEQLGAKDGSPIYRAPKKPKPEIMATSNDVVEKSLKTGPKRWKELVAALEKANLPSWSLNALIKTWEKNGKIQRTPEKRWSLVINDEAPRV